MTAAPIGRTHWYLLQARRLWFRTLRRLVPRTVQTRLQRRYSTPQDRTFALPDGAQVTLPRDWGDMTMEELAEYGVVPGLGGDDVTVHAIGHSGRWPRYPWPDR